MPGLAAADDNHRGLDHPDLLNIISNVRKLEKMNAQSSVNCTSTMHVGFCLTVVCVCNTAILADRQSARATKARDQAPKVVCFPPIVNDSKSNSIEGKMVKAVEHATQICQWSSAASSVGLIVAIVSPRGLCYVGLGDCQFALSEFSKLRPHTVLQRCDAALDSILQALIAIAEHSNPPTFDQDPLARLDMPGTTFQQKVWHALRLIPCGETRTYSQLAAAIDAPSAVRAVANACGRNPISLVVPCHRATHASGQRVGYHWGADIKAKLLANEARVA
jgi:AraC family transcriptional regulator of adaptative response/methylated-DNA-[protein]-cysteine methyltransferase